MVVWAAKSVIGGAGGFHARRRVRVVLCAVFTMVCAVNRTEPWSRLR